MNTQTQYRAAYGIGAFLGFIGVLTVGTGLGYMLGNVALQNHGCSTVARFGLSPCQKAMQMLGNRAAMAALVGLASIGMSIGMLYYLRRRVP